MTAALAGSLLIMASAVMATGFIVDYQRFSHGAWRRDPIGRHLMAYVAVDAIVLILGTVRFVGGAGLDTGWFAWLRVVVFLGVPWTIGWRWLILRRLYKQQNEPKGTTVKDFWSRVEAKVKAAGIGALVASLIAALINALLNGSVVPSTPHAWVQFLVITLAPPITAFVRGYLAPHESIPPVPTAKP